jgi:diamine N-acetyltransferase
LDKTLIESNEIVLSMTQIQDLDKIIEIERDKENSKFVYSWPKEKHMEVMESENWMHLTIRLKDSEKIIGYILLDGIKSEHDTIELTRIVINEKGKGYGRQSLILVKKLCFEKLGCHRLWLDMFDYNLRAISLYESEGFIHEGLLRECKKIDGNYYSMRIMSMLKAEYMKLAN